MGTQSRVNDYQRRKFGKQLFLSAGDESGEAENWNPGQMFQMERAVTALPKPLKLRSVTPAETCTCGVLGRSSGRGLHNEYFFSE